MGKTMNKKFDLTSKEKADYFRLLVGLDCFIKKLEMVIVSKSQFLSENVKDDNNLQLSQTFSLRMKITNNETIFYILFKSKENTFQKYIDKKLSEPFPVESFKTDIPNEIINLLKDAVRNNINSEGSLKNVSLLKCLVDFDKYPFHFVLGSGVNCGYSMPNWNALESYFKDAIDKRFGTRACESMSDATFNTNYGSFQIVKDIEEADYCDILSSMVDSSTNPKYDDNTILLAVAYVLQAQERSDSKQSVVTFNYDNLLEEALNAIGTDYSAHFNNKNSDTTFGAPVNIIHTHGYLPKPAKDFIKIYKNTIVLTTDEYIDNYRNPSSYGYRNLFNELNHTTYFIGNSITDYEEQKVIASHFKKHPSQFHFCFQKYEYHNQISMIYKTIFLLKIGVIVLWYNSHDDYKDMLFNFAEEKLGYKINRN